MIIHYSIPPDSPRRFETEANTVVLGRRAKGDSHIDLDLEADEYVSHLHARITWEDNACWIEDLGSSNGTFVDDQIITSKTRLMPESKVKVGLTIIEVVISKSVYERLYHTKHPDTEPVLEGFTVVSLKDKPKGMDTKY